MPWSQRSESIWSRPIDPTELTLKNMAILLKAAGREQWIVNTIFSLETLDGRPIPGTALLQAWTALRYQAPTIAVVLDGDDLTYETPSKDGLQAWQASTFFVHDHVSPEQYIQHAVWSDLCTLNWFPGTSQLMFRMHHWLIDGHGCVHIGRAFFKLLAAILNKESDRVLKQPTISPVFGDEWQRLQPGLIEASGLPTESTAAIQEKALQLALSLLGTPSAGLPYSGPPQLPGASKKSRLRVKTPVGDILAKCRHNQIALGAAIHSALAAAIYEVALPEHADHGYGTLSIFNYRPYLAESTDHWPVGAYIMGIPITIGKGDFLVNAKTVHAFYQQPIHGPDFASRDTYAAYIRIMADLMAQKPPEGSPLPTNPAYSSLGLLDPHLDQKYGSVIIKDFDLSVDVLLPPISFFQWTWNGVLNLSVIYNDAYFQAEFIEDFVKRVERNLLIGLGLN